LMRGCLAARRGWQTRPAARTLSGGNSLWTNARPGYILIQERSCLRVRNSHFVPRRAATPRLPRGRSAVMNDQERKQPTGDRQPPAGLLPAVYAELRRLAAVLSPRLPPGQTLQPTALVHEAYLGLVGRGDPGWEGRRHFFGAAARAMREILIAQAQRKASHKHGGHARRVELDEGLAVIEPPADDLLALDEAIQRLEA